jgi:hypothetical protein
VHRRAEELGLRRQHDAGVDVNAQRENGDGSAPDREAWRGRDGRHQPFEPLSTFGQLGGHARAACMYLDADMVRNEADDAFGANRREPAASVLESARQEVDPESVVGVSITSIWSRSFSPRSS